MATIIDKKTGGNKKYSYLVTYTNGQHNWAYLGRSDEVDKSEFVEGGVLTEKGAQALEDTHDSGVESEQSDSEHSTQKQKKPITREEYAGHVDGTELIDPDGWERKMNINNGEGGLRELESIEWKLDRSRMDGGDLLVKTEPSEDGESWIVNLGFLDEGESKTLVEVDNREEAAEKVNKWLYNNARNPPVNPDDVKTLTEENTTNGYVTDRETAEQWGEPYLDEDLAKADDSDFDDPDRGRWKAMDEREKSRQIDDDALIQENPRSPSREKWRVDISQDGEDAWNAVLGYTASNADKDEYDGDYIKLRGMSVPTIHGGEDRADTFTDDDIKALRDAVEFVDKDAEQSADEVFDGMGEVRELLAEYERS